MLSDLYLVDKLDDCRSICISELSSDDVVGSDAECLGGRGYFIYEVDSRPVIGGLFVLAKAVSFEAALRLAEMWRARASS